MSQKKKKSNILSQKLSKISIKSIDGYMQLDSPLRKKKQVLNDFDQNNNDTE